MTDYTQNVSYAPKDALSTGDAAKRIKGTELDAEFSEIATAISSKENTASKGTASGYCGLDSGGLVDVADLPASIPRLASSNTFTQPQILSGTEPYVMWVETDAAANNGKWRAVASAEAFYFQAMLDDLSSGTSPLSLQRTGTTIDSITFAGTQINLNCSDAAVNGNLGVSGTLLVGGVAALTSSSGLNASNINTGSIPAANVPQAAVTQHQAALTIAETQITDGSTLCRMAANEIISGTWTFNNIIGHAGAGAYPHYASGTQSGGAITVSTAAASGTPAAGDLWIQYTA